MKATRIITHRPDAVYLANVVFILSKGNNAGKPLNKACQNCFAVEFEQVEDIERFKSLCLVLFQHRIFEIYLRGSVIPFLTIRDFRAIILKYSVLVDSFPLEFENLVSLLVKIEHQEQTNKKTLQLLSEYRRALIGEYLRKSKV